MTAGKEFYDRQVAFLESGDVEGLINSQYHNDAVIISFDFTKRGHDALVQHFKEYLAHLGGLKLKSTDKFTETEDSIYFEATVTVGAGEAKVYDVFMLRDGKATHHFTGLISFIPKGS
ncbi:MAG: nuclear transport factor 2 family protein [Anaerolineae bacterium]